MSFCYGVIDLKGNFFLQRRPISYLSPVCLTVLLSISTALWSIMEKEISSSFSVPDVSIFQKLVGDSVKGSSSSSVEKVISLSKASKLSDRKYAFSGLSLSNLMGHVVVHPSRLRIANGVFLGSCKNSRSRMYCVA